MASQGGALLGGLRERRPAPYSPKPWIPSPRGRPRRSRAGGQPAPDGGAWRGAAARRAGVGALARGRRRHLHSGGSRR